MSRFRAAQSSLRSLRFLAALGLMVWLSPSAPAQIFVDDFDDNNDALPAPAWVRYNPIATGTWTSANKNYRIQSATSGSTANPGRAASYRGELTQTTFFESTDVVAWDNTKLQSFGLAARLGNFGLGTTRGYLFLYDTNGGTGRFNIYRVTNEAPTSIATGNLTLLPAVPYRFNFQGDAAGNFVGSVAAVAAPNTTLLSITNAVADTTYTSGNPGLLASEDTSGTISGADVTFDNAYFGPTVPVPEPASWALMGLGAAGAWAVRRRNQRLRLCA